MMFGQICFQVTMMHLKSATPPTPQSCSGTVLAKSKLLGLGQPKAFVSKFFNEFNSLSLRPFYASTFEFHQNISTWHPVMFLQSGCPTTTELEPQETSKDRKIPHKKL